MSIFVLTQQYQTYSSRKKPTNEISLILFSHLKRRVIPTSKYDCMMYDVLFFLEGLEGLLIYTVINTYGSIIDVLGPLFRLKS